MSATDFSEDITNGGDFVEDGDEAMLGNGGGETEMEETGNGGANGGGAEAMDSSGGGGDTGSADQYGKDDDRSVHFLAFFVFATVCTHKVKLVHLHYRSI